MAGNIKGITIEFNGDTTKLGSALREINTKTKEVDKALKDVNTALKFNPGNTELLAQKQTLLKEKIDQTKEKLEALREAQAKLDDDPAVDKTSSQYMELRREIIETESKLGHFEKELKKLDQIKFEQIGKQFKNIGNKMQTVGQGMSKYVTAPIVAGAAGATKAWKEVDNGLDIVTQKTGASGKELENMHGIVKRIAGEVPAEFDEIGSAVGEVNTRFHLTGGKLDSLSTKFLKFAKLNDVDVSGAIDKTQKALGAFGLDADDAEGVLDKLNQTGQATGVSMDSLMDGLIQNGTAFQELGLNIDQSIELMGQLETSGANSETVMQGLRKALKNAAQDGKPLNVALEELQDTIENGTDSTDGLTAAYELFGKSGDQIYGAVKNGTLDFRALGEAASEAGGSVENTFEETMDPADKFKLIMNELKVLGYEIAAVLYDMLGPAIEKAVQKVKELSDAWKNLNPNTQKTILKIAGLAAAIGPLLIAGGKLMNGIGGLITNIPKLTGALGKLTGGIGASKAAASGTGGALSKLFGIIKGHPILLIVGALAALTAAFVATGGDADAFSQKIKDLAGKATEFIQSIAQKLPEMIPVISEGAKALFGAIADAVPEVLPPLIDALSQLLIALVNAIPDLIPVLLDGAISLFMAFVDALPTVLEKLLEAVGNLLGALIKNFPTYYGKLLEAMPKLWGALWEGIKTIFKTIIDYLPVFIGFVVTGLADKLSGIWDKIKTTAKEKWENIKKTVIDIVTRWLSDVINFFSQHLSNLKRHWDDVKSAAKEKWNAIKEGVTDKVKTLKQGAEKLFGEHLSNLKRNWDETKQAANDKWNAIKDNVTKKVEKLKGDLAGFWEKIKTTAGEAWGKVKDAVLKPIETMKDKIKGIIDTIKGWFSNFTIKTPDIKLPHPYISPRGWTLTDLLDGITPSIDIDWYKTGGIFDSPTLAGIGEAGAEAVVPLDKFWAKMDGMADSIVNGLIVGLKTMQVQGAGPENVTIPIYLYPSGPKMGEETVKMYDTYKRRLK